MGDDRQEWFLIKNSEDFVNKIRDLEIPPPRKMVSYDVSALFTSIVLSGWGYPDNLREARKGYLSFRMM